MIKKLLFVSTLAFGFANAQTTLFEDDFDSYTAPANVGKGTTIPAGFTSYDVNADTYNWGLSKAADWTQPMGDYYSGNFLISASYITGVGDNIPVNADNIIVLPLISIPAEATGVSLNYLIGSGTDPDYFAETYDVIVTTVNSQAAIIAATPIYTETLPEQGAANHTISLDAYIGQNIYISFHHRNTYDQFVLVLDDVSVKTTNTLAVSDVNKKSVSIYPNPTTEVLNLNVNAKVNSADIYDLSGKLVRNVTVASDNKVNVKDLRNGTYVLKVNTEAGSTSHKFIKK